MEKSRFHYAFVIVVCCCLMMGVNVGLTFSCAGIFYNPVSKDLGIDVGVFGIYMSVMYVASALMLPFSGRLLERYSARKLFTTASALNGLTLASMGLLQTVWQFYVAGAFLGISMAFLLYMSYPTLLNRWFHTRMGLMTGIACAASGLGGVIFNPIGGAVISSLGWREAYFTFGGIVLFTVTPLLALLLRDSPESMGLQKFGATDSLNSAATHNAEQGKTFAEAKKMWMFYALIGFAFIMMGCSTLNLFLPGYAESTGVSLEKASLVASASMIGVTLGKLLLGYINDRSCMTGALLCTLGGAGGLLLLLAGKDSLPLMLTGSFFFGWCYAGVTVQTTMLTRTVMGTRDYARIFSVISIALSAGGAIASGGWGLLVDATSYTSTFLTGALFLAMACVISMACLLRKSPKSHSISQ